MKEGRVTDDVLKSDVRRINRFLPGCPDRKIFCEDKNGNVVYNTGHFYLESCINSSVCLYVITSTNGSFIRLTLPMKKREMHFFLMGFLKRMEVGKLTIQESIDTIQEVKDEIR